MTLTGSQHLCSQDRAPVPARRFEGRENKTLETLTLQEREGGIGGGDGGGSAEYKTRERG